jgi:hypothetical protein
MDYVRVLSFRSLSTRCAIRVAALAVTTGFASISDASSHGGNDGHAEGAAEVHGASADETSNGIGLGDFHIRSYYPVKAQKSIVHFVLFATAADENLADARRIAHQRKHKIRDQVIAAARMLPLGEFDEPDLKRFRRRILLRLRRTVPELLLDDVYVSDFQLKVQSL